MTGEAPCGDLRIREPSFSDETALLGFLRALHRTEKGDECESEPSDRELLRLIERCETLVAELSGEVVGMVSVEIYDEPAYFHAETRRCGAIIAIAVAEASRRRGVGARLMGRLCEWLAETGVATVTLHVRAANHDARRFYEKMGFEVSGLMMRRET